MKASKSEIFIPMLIAFGLLLAVIGCWGAWISLPLSGSFPGTIDEMLGLKKVIEIFRSAFLSTIVLAGVCAWFRYRLISTQIAFVSLVIVLGFVVYTLFYEYQWFVSYMGQSDERVALQRFISNYYWPNVNPDHSVTLISNYEYLWDRLLLTWNIIGVGLKVAFLGVIIVVLAGAIQKPVTARFNIIMGVIVLFGSLYILTPPIRADFIHHQGDALLNSGHDRQALDTYGSALRLDPMLQYSAPFLLKVSRAYYQLEGEHSEYAGLYMFHLLTPKVGGQILTAGFKKRLDNLRLKIDNISHSKDSLTTLQKAVIRQMEKRDARFWVWQGRQEFENEEYEESLHLYRKALEGEESNVHVQFFIADSLSKLKRDEEALVFLKSALSVVWTKQLRADIQCTIGERYEKLRKPLLAREAYTSCLELDSVYNYRAVLNLSGT